MVSITLDDRRSQQAREMEAERAHETALQKYFEDVGTLLIEQPLRRASHGDNLSTVVRAQTLAVLEGLRLSPSWASCNGWSLSVSSCDI
jgi:hypothetical protein